MEVVSGRADTRVASLGKWQITWKLELGFLPAGTGLQAAEAQFGSPGPDSRL
jgi:hypothetical protein